MRFSDEIINEFKPVHCPQCDKPMRKSYETDVPLKINGKIVEQKRDFLREIKFSCEHCDGWIILDLILKDIC